MVPPSGLEAYRRLKELREVFDHPIANVWHQKLAWKVFLVMDHKVNYYPSYKSSSLLNRISRFTLRR